jgi:Zn-dependent M28 family amino/carboxypeptidase
LETLRIIAESKFIPDREVYFMFYVAKEQGKLGSSTIANEFKRENRVVRSVLNYDKIGYVKNNK